jgi:hypothetical protein
MRASIAWTLTLFVFVLTAPVSKADNINFNFAACPSGFTCPGAIGASQTYTSDGLSDTVTGYLGPGTQDKLFVEQLGGDENGVGLNGQSHDEIQPGEFIQLNLSQFASKGITSGLLSIDSVQPGEGYSVCDSGTSGSMAGATCFSGHLDGQFFPITWSSSHPFIDVTATSGDVLVDDLEVSTPEPGTATLTLVGGVFTLFIVAFRRRPLNAIP